MSKNKNNNAVVVEETAPLTEEIVLDETPTTALAVSNTEFDDDEDKLTGRDLVIGRFKIVQGMTNGRKEHGLQEGQIYSTTDKKGFDKLLFVPIHEAVVVVERMGQDGDGKKKGDFVREYAIDDPVVVEALKKNGQSFINLTTPNGNKLEENDNIYFAQLDPNDGVTVIDFGMLVAHSTNLFPVRVWRNNRNKVRRINGKPFPKYSMRTWVDGGGIHQKKQTCLYRFSPFKNGHWKESFIDPDACTAEELALLRKCKEHKDLIVQGGIKVAAYTPEDNEEAQEIAAF